MSYALGGALGLLVGAIVVLTIQFTIGNPFMWLDDKITERRYKRRLKQKEKDNDNF